MIPFTGARYITIGIQNEIPAELQALMWKSIEEDRNLHKELDYLQVFELKSAYNNGIRMQEIVHTQEQPRRRKRITVENDNPVTAKVFVIDDSTHSTMLLNHEY